MNEEIKFNTNEDVLYQIAMIIYDRHNSNIASINEHLGDMFSYKDLEDAERYELEDEKHLLELAVKQLQQENNKLRKANEKKKQYLSEYAMKLSCIADYCNKQLGFLENCVTNNNELVCELIKVHRIYYILLNGEDKKWQV